MEMEVQKIFAKKNSTAQLFCRRCNTLQKIAAEGTQGGREPVRVHCQCGHIFGVRFDFRRSYRKKTGLEGHYATSPGYGDWVGMMVSNVSMDGIGFYAGNKPKLKVGDKIKIHFRLDDADKSLVQKEAVIKVLKNRYVGCQFVVKSKHYDKALGFYLKI